MCLLVDTSPCVLHFNSIVSVGFFILKARCTYIHVGIKKQVTDYLVAWERSILNLLYRQRQVLINNVTNSLGVKYCLWSERNTSSLVKVYLNLKVVVLVVSFNEKL